MIRCDKCGTFYEESAHDNCPKCGEKKHQSVGKCMLCGKEAERGDVCEKCINDYRIKAEEMMEESKGANGISFKNSKRVDGLNLIAGIVIFATIFGAIAIFRFFVFTNESYALLCVIAEICIGLFFSFMLKCYAERLEYMEHMTKQLEEIKEIIKMK